MNLLGFLGETEEMDFIIDPRPGTPGGLVTMNLRCPQGQTYDVVNQRCVNLPGSQTGSQSGTFSDWFSNSTVDILGIKIPSWLALASVIAGTVYVTSRSK